jgi:hypothetical protein
MDPEYIRLRINLQRVQKGIKTRAPGIGKCSDCTKPYIKDHSPVPYCPDCRHNHSVTCRDCGVVFVCDREGNVICTSCRRQEALF